jgi:hypothetical protein
MFRIFTRRVQTLASSAAARFNEHKPVNVLRLAEQADTPRQILLHKDVFGVPIRQDILHQVRFSSQPHFMCSVQRSKTQIGFFVLLFFSPSQMVVWQLAKRRAGTSCTKERCFILYYFILYFAALFNPRKRVLRDSLNPPLD